MEDPFNFGDRITFDDDYGHRLYAWVVQTGKPNSIGRKSLYVNFYKNNSSRGQLIKEDVLLMAKRDPESEPNVYRYKGQDVIVKKDPYFSGS